MEPQKLRLSEQGTSEFRNFGVMSAGKTKILRKKWKKITRYPGLQELNRTALTLASKKDQKNNPAGTQS